MKEQNKLDRRFSIEDNRKNKKGYTTTKHILLGFFVAISIGTFLLTLPISIVSGESDFLTALFTATTSVCVTGLVVVDTYSHWTLFGKIIILILIQLGGLGIVAITSAFFWITGRKVTLKNHVLIQDAFGLNSLSDLKSFVKKVFLGTFMVEGLGILLYLPAFANRFGLTKGLWFATFNSISAFCNAGIDIMGPDSLISFNQSPLVLMTSTMLIVMGGLGFVVWFDVADTISLIAKKKLQMDDFWKHLKTHTKLVSIVTLILLSSGAVIVFLLEYNNPETIGNMSLGGKILNSFFESVSLRTAGFAAVDQGGLRESTVMISIVYMLIGGSPVGTAGGIKTVTAAVLVCSVLSTIKGQDEATFLHRSINKNLIKRSLAVTFVSIMFFAVFSVLIMVTNGSNLVDTAFEMGSAVATVGLSRGLTGNLNDIGKIIVIITMYLGRIGPITMFIAFSSRYSVRNSMHYAEADILVG